MPNYLAINMLLRKLLKSTKSDYCFRATKEEIVKHLGVSKDRIVVTYEE